MVDARVQSAVAVSVDYFHGQRDAGDDAGDGFTIEVLNNGSVVDTMVSIGNVTNNAAGTNVSTTVTNPGNLQPSPAGPKPPLQSPQASTSA